MRVLVVEDESGLAEVIARRLRREGMAVDLALDGRAALAKALVVDYDAVVLDRDLPGIHGDEVCVTLVATERPPRILMLTASGEVSDRISGLDLGADDYLPKPFSPGELVARGASRGLPWVTHGGPWGEPRPALGREPAGDSSSSGAGAGRSSMRGASAATMRPSPSAPFGPGARSTTEAVTNAPPVAGVSPATMCPAPSPPFGAAARSTALAPPEAALAATGPAASEPGRAAARPGLALEG